LYIHKKVILKVTLISIIFILLVSPTQASNAGELLDGNNGAASISNAFSPHSALTTEELPAGEGQSYADDTKLLEESLYADTSDACEIGGSSSFCEPFDGSTIPPNWVVAYGSWSVSGGLLHSVCQNPDFWNSIYYNMDYSDFIYEARVRRLNNPYNSNALVIRGNPYPLTSDKEWDTAYYFQYSNDYDFGIWKSTGGGSWNWVHSWEDTSKVNPYGWNTLKVYASGNQMDFYINDVLVWSGVDDSFRAGKVGLSQACTYGGEFQVDYARLTDLSHDLVEKTADRKTVKPGEEITYTITVFNNETEPINNIIVEDIFNREVDIVSIKSDVSVDWFPRLGSATSDQANPINSDRKQTWHFGMLNSGKSITISLVVKTPEDQDFEFGMDQGVKGEGFVNVANDYNTAPPSYVLTNCVYVTYNTSQNEVKKASDCESVTVGEAGTELATREHGSGIYESEEEVQLLTANKSIEMNKDVAVTYSPTTLGLYRNRTATYSSKWSEAAEAKNRVTGASMTESYRYAASIDRESWMKLDKNESAMEVDSEFDGMGHIGFLKMPTNSTPGSTPIFEAREDYTGSFKILEKVDEYGSNVTSEKSTSGTGLVTVDKRIGESQRSYESGTGTYDSEELIETNTNYIAKDISLVYVPTGQSLIDDVSIGASQKWKEGMYSKVENTSYIGEEYTSATRLDKDTVAKGLNEMDTEAEFSGRARYRAVLRDEVDFDEQYDGDYSIERRILFTGIPKYDLPHLNVTKTLNGIVEETIFNAKRKTQVGESRDKVIKVATYTITIENDGNRAIGPVYVKDLFPPKAVYINASLRPAELTDSYANWTLTHLGIGDVSSVVLNLDVTEHVPAELVNRVEVCGGYNGDEWVCASNFTAVEKEWLSCCFDEISVKMNAELNEDNLSLVQYKVDIVNSGAATRVAAVTGYLPAEMVFLNSSIPFASYENDIVTWNVIEIGPSETKAIEYSVLALKNGRFTNSVEVDARSVDGLVVQPVYAHCVIDVGTVEDECGQITGGVWQPPNWQFEHFGYEPDDQTCELLTCAQCNGTSCCLAP